MGLITAVFYAIGAALCCPENCCDGAVAVQVGARAPNLSVLMNVSAYCPCEKCCGKWADGITSSGRPAEGFFIAAPPSYPFGMLMVIPGYADGKAVPVWDRGGAIKGNKLDIFFPTHQEALNWGRRYLRVRILKEGSGGTGIGN